MRYSVIFTALLAAASSTSVLAATLNFGDKLTITAGNAILDETESPIGFTGSYFGIDSNDSNSISNGEKGELAEGTTGLVIGVTSAPGANHAGFPNPSDSNAVTAPVSFLGTTGSWYFSVAPTGNTEIGLDMSGWRFVYNGLPTGGGIGGGLAWQPSNCAVLGCSGHTFLDGIGRFQWDGVYGHAYTLDYSSVVPLGDISGFGGYKFYTHLEGTVTAVPEPSPVWMFSAALLVMFGIARKREA